MNLQDRLRSLRGTGCTYAPYDAIAAPMLQRVPEWQSDIDNRRTTLRVASDNKKPTFKVSKPIPEDDLFILTKIYNKEYPDCGRKRGALLRYIKHYRETAEPVNHSRRLFKHIEKLVRRSRP